MNPHRQLLECLFGDTFSINHHVFTFCHDRLQVELDLVSGSAPFLVIDDRTDQAELEAQRRNLYIRLLSRI